MNIDEVYKIISYLVDKYQGAYISPDEFNSVINMAQTQYIEFLTDDSGNLNSNNPKYIPGQMQSSSISDKLSTFYKESTLTIAAGLADKPADMFTATSVRTSGNRPIKKVFDDNLATYLSNPIDAPTETEPIYMEFGTKFKFYPSSISVPILGYIRNPVSMKWAYTGNLVYSEVGSVQPEWGNADMNEIIYRAIGIIGINLKDGDLLRVAQTIKKEGQ